MPAILAPTPTLVEVPAVVSIDSPHDVPVQAAPPAAVDAVAVEPVRQELPAPLLALVEEPPTAEPAQAPTAGLPAAGLTLDQEPEPALPRSNGHGAPASLGFFT